MAGCMMFVFAALGEFVVVKVLDVQYQYQASKMPKMIPMVNFYYYLNMKIIYQKKKKNPYFRE